MCLLLIPSTVWAEGDSLKAPADDGAKTNPTSNTQAAPATKPIDSIQTEQKTDSPGKPPESSNISPEKPLPQVISEKKEPAGSSNALKLYSSGKYAEAATMYQKFISQGIDNVDTHMYLGACYQQLKKYDDALKQYDWVAKNAPLISIKKKGENAARTLRCYRAGICPGNCLKITTPGWAHYPGMDPKLLWMKFSFRGGFQAWSTHHLGEVIVYDNGKPVNKGKCPICHGTGKIQKLK
ncbi:MAG: hypothetical protein K2X81_03705 [Candidatus Obscuribacterales bacterium]|nr:hypothetical protein [Candidatus Obscuribacterales bacterium]